MKKKKQNKQINSLPFFKESFDEVALIRMTLRWLCGRLKEMSYNLSFSSLARSSSSGWLITPKEQPTQNIFLLKITTHFRRHRYYCHRHNYYFRHYHCHNFQSSSSSRISLPTQWENKKKIADSILFTTCTFKIKLWSNVLEHKCVQQTEKQLFTAWNSAFFLESALEIVECCYCLSMAAISCVAVFKVVPL